MLFLFLIPTDMLNDQTQINGRGSLPFFGLGLGLKGIIWELYNRTEYIDLW